MAAKLHIQLEQVEKAEEQLLNALKYNPQFVEAATILAGILIQSQRTDEARQLIESMIVRAPDECGLYMARAHLATQEHRHGDAIADLRKALALDSVQTQAVIQLARLLAAQKQTAEAAVVLQRFLEDNPDKKRVQLTLARIYIEQKNYDKAQSLLHALSGKKQFSGVVHLLLGEIYWQRGYIQQAHEEYKAAVLGGSKLLSDHPELCIINETGVDIEECVAEFRKRLEESGSNPLSSFAKTTVGE